MKKLLLTAALMLGMVGLNSVAYGGVKVSTSAFSVAYTTITQTGNVEILGVVFSTGIVLDYVDVFDSSTTLNSTNAPYYRFYNDNVISTATVSTLGSGKSRGPNGVILRRGGIFKPSSAQYNQILIIHDDKKP